MKVEFLNPFISAAMRVLLQEIGVSIPDLNHPELIRVDATRHPFNVVVGVTGSVQGIVVYGMELATAKAIIHKMVGSPLPMTDPVAGSALGELGNLITGAASMLLEENGYPCRISPPALIQGTAVRLTAGSVPMVTVPMETELGTISIYLALAESGAGGRER